MTFSITDKCTGCHACKSVCPNNAIYKIETTSNDRFEIHSKRCNGCVDQFDHPQCASICPIEEAILNEKQIPVNPKGSLTGIPIA